jgi:hypothetical protein
MTSMHTTDRPTNNDELAGTPTQEPTSRSRQAGIEWSERMFAQARGAELDAVRFVCGLEAE